MKIAIAQIRVLSANCKENFATMKKQVEIAKEKKINLIIFPEMALPGYFIGDIWEQSSFLKECESYHNEIAMLSNDIDIIFGSIGLDWNKKNEDGRVRKYNAVYCASQGKFKSNKKTAYSFWIKSLTPNYREFDDSRYFYDLRKLAQEMSCLPDDLYEPLICELHGKIIKIGVTICEDGWSSEYYFSPFEAFSAKFQHDFFINLSSSPFTKGKRLKREKLFSSISKKINTPIFYLNCVGVQNVGKTIYGFDGSSCFYSKDGNDILLGDFFRSTLNMGEYCFESQNFKVFEPISESNFSPIEEIRISLEYIIQSCLEEWKIKRVVIGSSGGVDSALSAVLFSRILGPENVYLVNMPSIFNSELTKNAAQKLSENLRCPYATVEIETSILHTRAQLESLEFQRSHERPNITGLVFENIQARDRGGRILSAVSASLGAVFSCNANKAELTVGYSTLYGDQAGFLCPLADLWKHDIYSLANYYNDYIYKRMVIPRETLEVVPSAELSENQNVMEQKGDPIQYKYHDFLFRSWLEHWDRKMPEDCLKAYIDDTLDTMIGCEKGLSKKLFPTLQLFIADLERWWSNYRGMGAFKRVQAPPIIAITRRAFGFDYREHIGNALFSNCYMNLKSDIEKQV